MSKRITVLPAPGRVVPDPEAGDLLPLEGREVPDNACGVDVWPMAISLPKP